MGNIDAEGTLQISLRPSLQAKREEWVRNVLRKGVEFTEELLRENEELRRETRRLDQENVRLRNQVASDDAIRDLLIRIDALEQERLALFDRSFELEVSQRQHEGRSRQVENELNDLASLYVASYQLSGCEKPEQAVAQVAELLEQLVGVERFVLYIVGDDDRELLPVAWQGYPNSPPEPKTIADTELASATATGIPVVVDPPVVQGNRPLAVVPLTYASQLAAVIVIEQLLSHKQEWASVDHEMFKVLSTLGATVLVAAGLSAAVASPRKGLMTLLDHKWSAPRRWRAPGTSAAAKEDE